MDKEFRIKITSEANMEGVNSSAKSIENFKEDISATGVAAMSSREKMEIFRRTALSIGAYTPGMEFLASGANMVGAAAIGAALAFSKLASAADDAEAEAEKLGQASRDAFQAVVKESSDAAESIAKATQAIDEFFDRMERRAASKAVQDAFKQQIKLFGDMAKAAEAAGLISKEQGAQFQNDETRGAQTQRLNNLEASIQSLTNQLKALQTQNAGAGATAGQQQLNQLKDDLANLDAAYKKGGEFYGASPTARAAGVMSNSLLSDLPQNKGVREGQYQAIRESIETEIKLREDTNKKLQDHLKLVEDTISEMTSQAESLKNDLANSGMADAANQFAAGQKIAAGAVSGQPVTQAQQNFLIVLEQSLTGHRQTWESAVRLIRMQSEHTQTAVTMLGQLYPRIEAVERTLNSLAHQQSMLRSRVDLPFGQ